MLPLPLIAGLLLLAAPLAAATENTTAATTTEMCTSDHRLSVFPIRLIKCSIVDLNCFRAGQYAFSGDDDSGGGKSEPKCTGLWTQGPCDKHQWLVIDKEGFFLTGYVRTVCQPLSLCPKGFVRMNFDGLCYSGKEVTLNCPKKRGYKIVYNVFGEGECVCGRRAPLPVRYCDTVAVGGSRSVRSARPRHARAVPRITEFVEYRQDD